MRFFGRATMDKGRGRGAEHHTTIVNSSKLVGQVVGKPRRAWKCYYLCSSCGWSGSSRARHSKSRPECPHTPGCRKYLPGSEHNIEALKRELTPRWATSGPASNGVSARKRKKRNHTLPPGTKTCEIVSPLTSQGLCDQTRGRCDPSPIIYRFDIYRMNLVARL